MIIRKLFTGTLDRKENLGFDDTAQVNDVQLSSVVQNISLQYPEIHVCYDGDVNKLQPKTDHKLSHSCGDMDNSESNPSTSVRSTSAKDMTLNISQSQSESALKNKLQNLTSPVTNVTKDLVLSPFSKIAKGMQNFGANLDVRKLSVSGGKPISGRDLEENKKIQEKWKNCKTQLILL